MNEDVIQILSTRATNIGNTILDLNSKHKVLVIFLESLQHALLEEIASMLPTLMQLNTVVVCCYWKMNETNTNITMNESLSLLLHCHVPLVVADMFGLRKVKRRASLTFDSSAAEPMQTARLPAFLLLYQGQVVNERYFESAREKIDLVLFVVENDDEIQVAIPEIVQLVAPQHQQLMLANSERHFNKQQVAASKYCCGMLFNTQHQAELLQDDMTQLPSHMIEQARVLNHEEKLSAKKKLDKTAKTKSIKLDVLVHDKKMRKHLLAFAANEHSAESILFLEEVIKYQQIKSTVARTKRATEIIHTFLIPDGFMPVNINSSHVLAIQSQLEQEGPIMELFQRAADDILVSTVSDVFWRFKSSKSYKKMISTCK